MKIPEKHRGPHKTSSWATCGPRVACLRPWSNTVKQEKTRSHITLQQFGQSQTANIRVGLCWLTECQTGTFWLTDRDAGTKPIKPGLSLLKRDVWYAYLWSFATSHSPCILWKGLIKTHCSTPQRYKTLQQRCWRHPYVLSFLVSQIYACALSN